MRAAVAGTAGYTPRGDSAIRPSRPVSILGKLGNPAVLLGSQRLGTLMGTSELARWLRQAPPGTLVQAAEIAQLLADTETVEERPGNAALVTWREKLWTCPPETRLGRAELLEALGRSDSWLYRHTGPKAKAARIPCRRLDGELVFIAGEVRTWLAEQEEVLEPGHTSPVRLPRGTP